MSSALSLLRPLLLGAALSASVTAGAPLVSHGSGTGGFTGGTLLAQEPPDSLPADSLARTDSLVADSLALPDSLRADSLVADSLEAADTVFYNLPTLDEGPPSGFARGIWRWTRDEILAIGANTVLELVDELPGMVPVRGGDYGTPQGLSAFGLGGGGVRVFRDGVEMLPLAGGSPDLQRVGLAGVQEVRLERRLDEIRLHLTSVRYDDPRPYSMVEAGTGDLDTNIFRGTFANPTALGGSVALSLDRTDTRGPAGDETGNRNGVWLRYQLHRGDRGGMEVAFQRVNTETEVEEYASATRRQDWHVRGRARLVDSLVADAYWGRSSYQVEDTRTAFEGVGGDRSQLGLRLGWSRHGVFARGAYRRFGGEALPAERWSVEAGGDLPRIGGASASWERAGWEERSVSATHLQAWTAPLFGFSVFASRSSGGRAARTGPLRSAPVEPDSAASEGAAGLLLPPALQEGEPGDSAMDPSFRTVDRTTTRYGAQWAWREVALAAARLRVESDSLLPLGLAFDQGEPALPGGTREGWEVQGRVPLPVLDGLALEGSYQRWDQEVPGAGTGVDSAGAPAASPPEAWRYLPRRVYRGALLYRNTFLESGNLELRGRLGVRGRDPMRVHRRVESDGGEAGEGEGQEVESPELQTVPFYQNWYVTLQVRIVTVRIFVGWSNVAVRQNLQDVPGRVLPATRAVYGIQWTLWN